MSFEEIAKLREQWEEKTLKKVLDRFPERSESFQTDAGVELRRVYSPLDVEDSDYQRDLGFPGEYPFTRGIQPTMYRGRLWTIRQYAGFANARESNRRYHYLLEQGQTVRHALDGERHGWLQVVEGDVAVNGTTLSTGDGAAISGEAGVELVGAAPYLEALLFDLG